MKRNYELVCVIDTALITKDIVTLKEKIHQALPEVVAVDDMGLLPLAYSIRGQDQAYFVSYHILATQEQVLALKSMLRLEKNLVRYVFYAMQEHEAFLTFKDLQKSYNAIVIAEEEAKMKDQIVDNSIEENKEKASKTILEEEVIENASEE